MERQLDLLPPPSGDEWRIDEATRAAGRRGLARARAALADAQARLATDTTHHRAA
jgi:hypothetical protein